MKPSRPKEILRGVGIVGRRLDESVKSTTKEVLQEGLQGIGSSLKEDT